MLRHRFLSIALLLAALPGWAWAQATVSIEGVSFERHFYLAGHKVWLNGAGLGTLGDAPAFVAAFYLAKPARQLAQAQASPGPKRLRLVLRQPLDSRQLGALFSRTFELGLSATEMATCMPGLAQLGQVFGARKKLNTGDQLLLDSLMSQGTVVSINGDRLTQISGTAFFDCLAKGFLGEQSADAPLRAALLAALPR